MSVEQLIELKVSTVYGASKHWQEVAQAPSAVSILTAEEIKLHGYRTLADLLRSVRGLYVSYDRNYSYLGIRGFNRPGDYNTRTLLLIDGHRINDHIQDGALVGNEFLLDVDLIDRVEIIRGPGSSIYGNNAFFGVINIITKTGGAVDGAEVSGEAGRFQTYKGQFTYGKTLNNGLTMLFSGSYFDSQGPGKLFYKEYDAPESNNGVARHVDDEAFYSAFGTLSWSGFTLAGGYRSREKGIPTGSFDTVFNSRRNRTIDTRGYADLSYQQRLPGEVELQARLFYDHFGEDGHYLTDVAPAPPPQLVLNLDRFRGDWWGSEVKASKTLFERHTLTLGAELRDNWRQDLANFNERPRTVYLDDRRNSWVWAFYGQAEVVLRTNLTFHVGVRYDYSDTFGDELSPRLALLYAPLAKTTVKLIYGRAFRAPNHYELFYNDGGLSSEANPHLRPEFINTYEAIWEQQLPRDCRLSLAGFYYRINDLITLAEDPPTGLLQFRNLQDVEAWGGELEVERHWSSGLRARASYSSQWANDLRTGERLSNSPRHLAKFNLIVPLMSEELFTALELQYTSGSRTLTGHSADAFWIANLSFFSQKLVRNLELSASVYNLFATKYGFPGSGEHRQDILEQDGRSFRVKVTYHF